MRRQRRLLSAAGSRRRIMLAGLLAAGTLGLAACTNAVAGAPSGVEIGPLTTAELADASLVNFAESAAAHYKGSLTGSDGSGFTVDLTGTITGEVFGAITVNGLGATVIVLDKTLYLKGAPEFWAAMAKRFGVTSGDGTALGNRWVKLPTVLLGVEFGEIFTPDVVRQTAGKATGKKTTEPPKDAEPVAGVDAFTIPVDGGTVYVAKDAPHGVVKFELGEIGSTDTTMASDLAVEVTDVSTNINKIYTDLATQAKAELGLAVDALTTIDQGAHRFEACGAPSCALVIEITNPSKKAVRVHLKADWNGDNAPLGSCEAQSEPVAPGAGATMSCKIASPQWVSFYQRANSVPGTHPYGAVWTALALADSPNVAALDERGAAKPADPKERKADGSHAVYEISYADKVWKYGVVASRYWREHAAEQVRGCLANTKSVCTYSLVAAAKNPVSAYALASQLVTAYRSEHGECPVGQWVSCAL